MPDMNGAEATRLIHDEFPDIKIGQLFGISGVTVKKHLSVVFTKIGAETPTQMATLRWTGDGEFMSWRWKKLGEAFEDGAARFAAESRIVSPTECIICGCGGSR